MANDVVPIFPKFSFIRAFKESVAVSIPTREVIPMAIIMIVRIERNLVLRMDLIATSRFSFKSGDTLNLIKKIYLKELCL